MPSIYEAWTRRDPMARYDQLPPELRSWLRDACLPWSPASAHKIWTAARQGGLSDVEALKALTCAESKTLARERAAGNTRKTLEP